MGDQRFVVVFDDHFPKVEVEVEAEAGGIVILCNTTDDLCLLRRQQT